MVVCPKLLVTSVPLLLKHLKPVWCARFKMGVGLGLCCGGLKCILTPILSTGSVCPLCARNRVLLPQMSLTMLE